MLPSDQSHMTTLDVLRAARERITDPAKWSAKGWGAYNRQECALAALSNAAGRQAGDPGPIVGQAEVQRAAPCNYLGWWNDNSSHAEVLAAFDRAIANEEAAIMELEEMVR